MRFLLPLFVACTVLPAASLAQPKTLMYDQLLKPRDAVMYHVPIGLCEDYPEETTTLDIIREDMELLKRAGIRLLRISFGWDGIETRKNSYHWGFWDDFVRIAVDEYGVTLVPYICYTPAWNSTGDTSNYWNHPPKDYDEFGKFVYDLVTKYKSRIKSWELWNEPDNQAYWTGSSEAMARLTKIGAVAVRSADPQARVVLGGLAGRTEFTLALFREYGISPYVDVVNIHNYFETWAPQPMEDVVEYVKEVSDIIHQYGADQPLWMAEVGYSSYRRDDGYVSWDYRATYTYEHTPAYQAVALSRMLSLLLSTDRLSAITWYEVKDLPPGENVIGDVNNRHLGVANVDHSPKPAEGALTFFNTLFSQKCRCIDDAVTVRRTQASDSEVHTFRMEDGSVIVAAWLKTCIPARLSKDRNGRAVDARRESLGLVLPYRLPGDVKLYDERGGTKPFTSVRLDGESTILDGISLTGGTVCFLVVGN